MPSLSSAFGLPRPFPIFDSPRPHTEKGMGIRFVDFPPFPVIRRTPLRELAEQVFPFIIQLSLCDRQRTRFPNRSYFRPIERISPGHRLRKNGPEIRGDGGVGTRLLLEPFQLGMPAVPAGLASQHGLGEQGLAPERDKTSAVKVFRVQGPETHSLPASA